MAASISDVERLIYRAGANGYRRWQTISVTYSFVTDHDPPAYYTSFETMQRFVLARSDLRAPSAKHIAAFDAAARAWESVANIRFTSAEIGSIVLGQADFGRTSTEIARTNLAGPDAFDGDMFFAFGLNDNKDQYYNGSGSSGYWTMLHELGHAIGLTHQDEPAAGQSNPATWVQSSDTFNSTRYTVLSYKLLNGQYYQTPAASGFASRPMLLDIAAVQRLYGANASTSTADDTYAFSTSHGWPIQAIWDAGGNDTIDGSGINERLRIDLSRGGESYQISRDGARINERPEIHIAFQPTRADGTPDPAFANNYIENAVGGPEDDIIAGNDIANNLNGGDGGDNISGGLGDDVIVGGRDSGPLTGRRARIDHLEGGVGFDTYVYATGDWQDEIADADGLGEIRINAASLTGAFQLVDRQATGYSKYLSSRVWQADVDGALVYLIEQTGDVGTGATLLIEGAALGVDGSIKILNFVSNFGNRNDLGISLDPTPIASVTADADPLGEQSSKRIRLDFAVAAVEDGYVRISASSFGANLVIVNGADSLSLAAGYVDLALVRGRQSLELVLLSTGDVDFGSATFNLSTQVFTSAGVSDVASVAINYQSREELFLGSTARQAHIDGNGLDVWTVRTATENGTAASPYMVGTAANELIFGSNAQGAGIDSGDYIDGGAGSDFIAGGRGADTLLGGDGNDYVRGSQSAAYFEGHNANLGLPTLVTGTGWGLLDAGNGGYWPLNWAYNGSSQPFITSDAGNYIDGVSGNNQILGEDAETGIGQSYLNRARENAKCRAQI